MPSDPARSAARIRVWCRSGVVRLGGTHDGCKWVGYRRLATATAKPCPICGSEVVRV